MSYRDADSEFGGEYRTHPANHAARVHSWNSFNGDGTDDRDSQQAHARDWYDRNERRREARLQHYLEPLNEEYGNADGSRVYFDPDINRGGRYGELHPYSWREGGRQTDREQDYRGGRWHRDTHGYHGSRSPEQGRWDHYSRSANPESREYGDYSGGSTEQDFPDLTGYATAYDQRFGRGGFAGIAPKNYQRSDERIQEELCERLTAHPDIDPSNVEINVVSGEVKLSGEVPTRRMKRMIEEVAEDIPGVRDINNQIHVSPPLPDRGVHPVGSQRKSNSVSRKKKIS